MKHIGIVYSPWKVFFFSWLFTIILFEMRLSYLIDGLNFEFALILILNIFIFSIGYFGKGMMSKKLNIKTDYKLLENMCLRKVNRCILILWIIITVFESVYSGGIPIFWYLNDVAKTYVDFGINGIHGFANAIYMIICLNFLYLYFLKRNRSDLYFLLVLLIWPILVISRQVLIVAILELFFLLMLQVKVNRKFFFKCIVGCILLVFGFGWLGDFRSGKEAFLRLAQPRYEWLENMPSGVLWVGLYVTTPMGNMKYMIENTEPNYDLSRTLGRLLPTPIREKVFDDVDTGNDLVTPAFNVSSYMYEFYKDFGVIYIFLATFIIGIISRIIYEKTREKRNYFWIMNYCVINQMLVLSIFFNHFLYLPVAFQFVVIFIVNSFCIRRMNSKSYGDIEG